MNALLCTADDRAAWLAARKVGIGASEIAAVLGVSPFCSALELWARKTGRIVEEEKAQTERMFWGLELEEKIARVTCQKAGVVIQTLAPGVFSHDDHKWMLASPDGIVVDSGGNICSLEVKNIDTFAAKKWENIPEHYLLQCQQQMIVMDAQRCLWGGLIGGNWHVWAWIERDEKECRRIIDAGNEFWKLVESDMPPPSDGSESAHKVALDWATEDETVELFDNDVGDALREREESEKARKYHEGEAKALKQRSTEMADNILLQMAHKTKAFTATGWSIVVGTTKRKGFEVKPTEYKTVKIKAPKE